MRYTAACLLELELRSANQRRHWSPASQPYAPADVLLEYLAAGWNLNSVVERLEHWYGAGRHVGVYYFELTRDNRVVVMPVHDNPAMHRLVWERQLKIVPLSSDDRLEKDEAIRLYPLQCTEVECWAALALGRQQRCERGNGVTFSPTMRGSAHALLNYENWYNSG